MSSRRLSGLLSSVLASDERPGKASSTNNVELDLGETQTLSALGGCAITKEHGIKPLSVQRVLDEHIQCEWCKKCASPNDPIFEYTLISRQRRYFHSGCFKLAGGLD